MSRITRIGLDHLAIARAYARGQEDVELEEQRQPPGASPAIQAPPKQMRGDRPDALAMLPGHLANAGNIPQNLTTGRIAGFMEQQRAPALRTSGKPSRAGSGVVVAAAPVNKQNKRGKGGGIAIGQAGRVDKNRPGQGAGGRKAGAKR